MITGIINGIFTQVMTATGIPLLSDKQKTSSVDIPGGGVYGTYCILTNNPCNPMGDIVEYTAGTDPASGLADAAANFSEENSSTISINVTSRAAGVDADTILEAARTIFHYMKRMSYPGAVIRIISASVQERTAYLDAQFAYQYGFDVFIDIMDSYNITITAIQGVKGTITINPGNRQVPLNVEN